jgi:hypothetical protein
MAGERQPVLTTAPAREEERLLTVHDFGVLSRRAINGLTALAFVLFFAGVGIFVTHPTHAASVPELKSGIAGKCLQDRENTSTPTTPAHVAELWTCDGSEKQQITISGQQVMHGGLCLATQNGGTTDGTAARFFGCNGANNQAWNQTNNTLVNVQAGKCLDDPSSTTANGAIIQIWGCNGTAAQRWVPASFVLPPPPPTVTAPPPPPPSSTVTPPTPPPGGGGGGGGGSGGGSGGGGSGGGGSGGSGGGSGGSGGGSSGGSGGSGSGGSGADAGAVTQPVTAGPAAPTGFQASVAGDNAVVALRWDLLSDSSAIVSYQVDRSLDQATWSPLAANITGNKYADTSANFGIHYYYRLRAVDAAGNSSDFAFSDVTTPDFTSNASSAAATVYHSQDGVAAVSMPSGAVDGEVDCSVAGDSTQVQAKSGQRVVVGPYQLVCKDQSANAVSSFSQPLTWTFNLKGKLGGLRNPLPYSADSSGNIKQLAGAKFTSSSSALSVSTPTSDSVLVQADVVPPPPWNLIAFVLLVLGILTGLAVFIVTRARRSNYNDYLRQKYYNF